MWVVATVLHTSCLEGNILIPWGPDILTTKARKRSWGRKPEEIILMASEARVKEKRKETENVMAIHFLEN